MGGQIESSSNSTPNARPDAQLLHVRVPAALAAEIKAAAAREFESQSAFLRRIIRRSLAGEAGR